jgi:HAMP domain-containing protein
VITPVFPSRRAERFAQLLDEAAGTRRHHVRTVDEDDLSGLVTIGQRVSTLPLVVEVDPEFRTGLRASLMARIEREGIGATATEPESETPQRRRISDLLPSGRTRSAIIATVAAGSFGAFGVSAASGDAIPGDALYGVKRSAEQAQLALAGSDVSRGQLNLEFAKKRLTEAGALGSDAGRLDPVLDDMDLGMRDGSRLLTTAAIERGEVAGLQVLQQFSKDQRPILANLVNRLEGPAKGRASESLGLLDRINSRAGGLQQTVKCPGIDVPLDELGALPVTCVTAAPAQDKAPAQTAPEATAKPALPTATATPNGPAAEAVESPSPPSVEAGGSSSPGVAAGQGADDGVLESIKKALEGIFG